MILSEVGRAGQDVDVLHGGDVDPDGRLLSVAEIQQELRALVARKTGPATAPDTAVQTHARTEESGAVTDQVSAATQGIGPGGEGGMGTGAAPGERADLDPGWISIVAAHSGAGASTVALAIADAAALGARHVHLVETAHPSRSGLLAAAGSELGTDATTAWRRGSRGPRGQIIIDRRAGDTAPADWPVSPVSDQQRLVLVDLGLPTPGNRARLAASGARTVVVCRPTVPGVRLAEQLLAQLGGQAVVVAAVGPGKWPAQVSASLGPLLRALRANNRVVSVPVDRHLEVSGPTNSPLPKPVATAARVLLGLIDAAQPGDVATARSASRMKGTMR